MSPCGILFRVEPLPRTWGHLESSKERDRTHDMLCSKSGKRAETLPCFVSTCSASGSGSADPSGRDRGVASHGGHGFTEVPRYPVPGLQLRCLRTKSEPPGRCAADVRAISAVTGDRPYMTWYDCHDMAGKRYSQAHDARRRFNAHFRLIC